SDRAKSRPPRPKANERSEKEELAHRPAPQLVEVEPVLSEPRRPLVAKGLPAVHRVPGDRGREGREREERREVGLLPPQPSAMIGAEREEDKDANADEDAVILSEHRESEEDPRGIPPRRPAAAEDVSERPEGRAPEEEHRRVAERLRPPRPRERSEAHKK